MGDLSPNPEQVLFAITPEAVGGVVNIGPGLFISPAKAMDIGARYQAAAREAERQGIFADAVMRHTGGNGDGC